MPDRRFQVAAHAGRQHRGVRMVRYQGTKDETEELIPLKIDSNLTGPIVVKLADGRRTETAYVPPEGLNQPAEEEGPDGRDEVMSKLFRFSEEENTGVTKGFASGSSGAPASPRALPRAIEEDKNTARTMYQQRVRSLVSTGVDVTAQAVLSADRQSVRVRFEPVFDTPVTFEHPEQAIGTHVYTALAVTNDNTTLRWNVPSLWICRTASPFDQAKCASPAGITVKSPAFNSRPALSLNFSPRPRNAAPEMTVTRSAVG